MDISEGYLLCAFGNILYHKLSKRIITNIRQYDSERKICILTDKPEYYDGENLIIINFDYKDHLHPSINIRSEWNIYGLIPKIYQYMYTPFKITCFIDVDMIIKNDFTFVWEEFYRNNTPILIGGKCDENNKSPSQWHWNKIDTVIKSCGFNCPQICGTVFIYNELFISTLIDNNLISYVLDNLDKFNVCSFFRGGYPDEIVYSIILGKLNIKPSTLLDEWFYDKNNCDSCEKNI